MKLDRLGIEQAYIIFGEQRRQQREIVDAAHAPDIETFQFWKQLHEEGIFTNPVVSPAVPPGEGLIRTSYMATHTDEQLDLVLETVGTLGKQFEVI